MSRFAHLHQHTQYSLLDGAARIKDLIKWVKEISENPTVAMTDHGNMHGAVQFFKAAIDQGVKPIVGYEAYVAAGSRFDRRVEKGVDGGYFHLTLLAKDFKGYQSLCRLSSTAFLEGYYYKPRIDREILSEYSQGLIAMSGCLGAEVPNLILQGRLKEAEERLIWYQNLFKDDYYVEIQDHGLPEQKKVNPILKEWANKYGIGMVATNDGHYVKAEDSFAHETLLAIQTKAFMSQEDRFKFPCDEFYVKTPEQMRETLKDWQEEIFDNTMVVADKCDLELPIGSKRVYQMPQLPIPQGRTMAEELRAKVYEGLTKRYQTVDAELYRSYAKITLDLIDDKEKLLSRLSNFDLNKANIEELNQFLAFAGSIWQEKSKEEGKKYTFYPALEKLTTEHPENEGALILARAEYELGVIIQMGFPDYFLIVADFIVWAKEQGISVGPGRGSGAGSIVAYALSITNLDPLEYGLLFERFLNPDRVSMPDFDIDFSDARRGEVIEYVRQKYGDEKVAYIATFGTMSSRAVFKDVARVMELPYAEADKLSKLVPVRFGRALSLNEAEQSVPDIREMLEKSEQARQVFDTARSLEGLTRHASVHASGVVIGREPLVNLVPLMRDAQGQGMVCQVDMSSVEEIGLIKMDFLGLRTLSFLEEAAKIIKQSKNVEIKPDEFPIDDKKTYELLSRGETKGVFQLEGTGITDASRKLKPRRIQDIIALSALYRPGPMENIPTYIERHHGREEVRYDQGSLNFPNCEKFLRPILSETYGIPVYQEQIMQIASEVAGYSLGQADLLRRCIAKGTPIIDADTGQRIPIESIKPGQRVLTIGPDQKLCSIEINEVFDNGEMEVFRVQTRTGRIIELTKEHPLLTTTGWKHLNDLRLGNRVAVPNILPIFGNLEPDQNRVKIIAYLIGDGNTIAKTRFGDQVKANFYNSNLEILDDYETAARNFGCNTKRYAYKRTSVTMITVSAVNECNPVLELVKNTEINKKAHKKRIPDEVFTYCRKSLALFLGKLWSTDGSIENARISYSSSSQGLIDDVTHLLLRFGINSIKRRKLTTHRPNFELLITDQDDVLRFAGVIGAYLVNCKQEKLAVLVEKAKTRQRNQSIYDIPITGDQIAKAKKSSGLTWQQAGELIGTASNRLSGGLNLKNLQRALSRHRLDLLGRAFDNEELRFFAQSDLIWDPIIEIKCIGVKKVFDLSVPPFFNFIAADFVVHNSMGKKKVDEMARERSRFVEGAAKTNNIPLEEAGRLFDLLESFANYGFNKSHSAAYAFISFQTAYIKAHYPVEFMAALLTVERHNSDKVAEYINDARQITLESGRKIEVLPPDINLSDADFKVIGEKILFGLFAIKNLGDEIVKDILSERKNGGKFKSLPDFCARMHHSGINRRGVESLIKAGAFDAFKSREALLNSVDDVLSYAAGQAQMANEGTNSLFALATIVPEPKINNISPPEDEKELRQFFIKRLKDEKEAVGLYITGHPLEYYPGMLEAGSTKANQIEAWYHSTPGDKRKKALLSGLIEGITRRPTKSGGMMARFNLTDDVGTIELVAFNRAYDKINSKLVEDMPALVVVDIEPDIESFRLAVEDIISFEETIDIPKLLWLEIDLEDLTGNKAADLDDVLREQSGGMLTRLRLDTFDGYEIWDLENVRANLQTIEELKRTCPWVKAKLAIDGRAILAKFKPNRPWEKINRLN